MLTLNFPHDDFSPRPACHPVNMNSPVSPTYTAYSAPSPFSSSSSASYPNRSPVSDPFESASDPDHHPQQHPGTMDNYPGGYQGYNDLPYIAQDFDFTMSNWSLSDVTAAQEKRQPHQHQQQFQPQSAYRPPHQADLDRFGTMDACISPVSPTVFQHTSPTVIHSPVPIPSYHSSPPSHISRIQAPHRVPQQQPDDHFSVDGDHQQLQYRGPYPTQPPPSSHSFRSPAFFDHSQNTATNPAMVSNENLQRSVAEYSTNDQRIKQEEMDMYASLRGTVVQPSLEQQQQHHHHQAQIFDVGLPLSKAPHPHAPTSNVRPPHHRPTPLNLDAPQAPPPPPTSSSPYFSGGTIQTHPSPDLSLSNLHIRDPRHHQQVYAANPSTNSAMGGVPSASIAADASFPPSASGQNAAFEAHMVQSGGGNGSGVNEAYMAVGEPQVQHQHRPVTERRYTQAGLMESEYVDMNACDAQYPMSSQPRTEVEAPLPPPAQQTGMWDGGYYSGETHGDQDAEGEDDIEGFSSPQSQFRISPSEATVGGHHTQVGGGLLGRHHQQHHPPQHHRVVIVKEEEGMEGSYSGDDLFSARSEGGSSFHEGAGSSDRRDSEFVVRSTRPRRHTYTSSSSTIMPASYAYSDGRNSRSSRYNPYPSASPNRIDDIDEDEFRRTLHAHTSVSPALSSEPYSPISMSSSIASCPAAPSGSSPLTSTAPISLTANQPPPPRRRTRGSSTSAGSGGGAGDGGSSSSASHPTLPIPIPVPNLTKKSRGRRVPTVDDFHSEEWPHRAGIGMGSFGGVSAGGRRRSISGTAGGSKLGLRTYTCNVDGCGKLFARGEHLKRHIRSIHTYEKPHLCPYPGCGKDFSRHDNLGQHMRVHKDYVPPPKKKDAVMVGTADSGLERRE